MRRQRFEWALTKQDQRPAKIIIHNGTFFLREQKPPEVEGKIIKRFPAGSQGVKWMYVNTNEPNTPTVCSIRILKQTSLIILPVVEMNVDVSGVAYVVVNPSMRTEDDFYWEMKWKSYDDE
jgi:hypothetical protein